MTVGNCLDKLTLSRPALESEHDNVLVTTGILEEFSRHDDNGGNIEYFRHFRHFEELYLKFSSEMYKLESASKNC